MNKKSIWFSRHQPTAEQVADAAAMGYEIVTSPEMTKLASVSLETDADVNKIMAALDAETDAFAIFGVFAAPIQNRIYIRSSMVNGPTESGRFFVLNGTRAMPCYAAWNISRTPEGGKPTFSHREWLHVGFV